MKTFFAALFPASFCLLTACVSPPPEVTAQVPLISKSTLSYSSAEVLPEDLWASLNNAYQGNSINSDYGSINVENTYVSAMGHWCIAFSLVKNDGNKTLNPQSKYYGQDRRACKSDSTWFFISPLMTDYNGVVND
ncbi:hypothetical protein RI844_19435 [Thalassotalea fonticola]|uniref:Surface antigen domain-containing protein n=1 Tax=Thalassotalea fonticola TaxID=3065649 RepID=A0ABZ0GQ66_9GAMM|nr:hypothetical protein RI844_19435 [Colwelliaceae bacterium S1-1]